MIELKKRKKIIIFAFVVLLFGFGILAIKNTKADTYTANINIENLNDTNVAENSYSYNATEKILSLSQNNANYLISGENNNLSIKILENKAVKISTNNLKINESPESSSPIDIEKNVGVEIILLSDTENLLSSTLRGGVEIASNSSLTIKGEGRLVAESKVSSQNNALYCAIGTKDNATNVSIKIKESAKVEANGQGYSTGVGSGQNGFSTVEITENASVKAIGGSYSAGIGSGYINSYSNVNISASASVSAVGGNYGAGIGSGYSGSFTKINISGDANINSHGGGYSAGIGSGYRTNTQINISGNPTIYSKGGSNGGTGIGSSDGGSGDYESNSTIVIAANQTSSIRAIGGSNAAGIGSAGYDSYSNISIYNNSVVYAKGGTNSAGIGTGPQEGLANILIKGDVSVTAIGGSAGAGIGSGDSLSYANITLSEYCTIYAKGGSDSAGIGSGSSGANALVVIDGKVSGSRFLSVVAVGAANGSGIGSGKKYGDNPSDANVTIKGQSTVSAIGGNNGAGIGSGPNGSKATVNILGKAYVEAKGGINSTGIGPGNGGKYNIFISETPTIKAEKGTGDICDIGQDYFNKREFFIDISGYPNINGSYPVFISSTMSQQRWTYTGEEKKPTMQIELKYQVTDVQKNIEGLSFQHENNVNIGTGTVKAKFKDILIKSDSFTIDAPQILSATVPKSAYVFSGNEIKPLLNITAKFLPNEIRTSIPRLEYTYENNINIGKATVRISVNGHFLLSRNFDIIPKIIAAVIPKGTYVYTGKTINPRLTIKAEITQNKISTSIPNLVYTYKNNLKIGKATVAISWNGYLLIVKTFKIVPKAPAIKKVSSKNGKTTLTVKKVSGGVTGYIIYYKKASDKKWKSKKIKTSAKTLVLKLTKKKKYYFKVVSFKTVNGVNYKGRVSKIVKKKIK